MSTASSPRWQPSAGAAAWRARAQLLERLRAFFRQAGVLEVETPACSFRANTDPAIESFACRYFGPGPGYGELVYLHTSPEFPMKRLLAAGSGPIYQVCKVFRDGERGRLHNPEFTLLEWYRPGLDHHGLMDEVAALVRAVARRGVEETRLTYAGLFADHLGVDPHAACAEQLRHLAVARAVPGADALELDRDGWLDLLLTHCIEPRLEPGRMTFVYDYPRSQAALARVRPGDPAVAERFELYLGGMELANGFHELTDAGEQQARFNRDLAARARRGQAMPPPDDLLLAALNAGVSPCAGVALGIDRLLMWLTGARDIAEVLTFAFDRA